MDYTTATRDTIYKRSSYGLFGYNHGHLGTVDKKFIQTHLIMASWAKGERRFQCESVYTKIYCLYMY